MTERVSSKEATTLLRLIETDGPQGATVERDALRDLLDCRGELNEARRALLWYAHPKIGQGVATQTVIDAVEAARAAREEER